MGDAQWQGVVNSACVVLLVANVSLVLFILSSSPSQLASAPALCFFSSNSQSSPYGASSIPEKGSAAFDLGCFDAQLQRAEASYKRNQARRSVLTGTLKEQSIPFSGAAQEAFVQARPDQRWSDVYLKEYMLFPKYPCLEEERVGMWGEGGKWVCLQSLHKKGGDLIVYSIGSLGDTSFEEGMFQLLGARSETFDPFLTEAQDEEVKRAPFVRFHNYGLSMDGSNTVTDREKGLTGPSKDVHTMMKELNHTFVDVFKIDCEGCESGFVDYLFQTTKRAKPVLGQILMEIHDANNLALESQLMQQLAELGYRLFHLEPNFFGLGNCWEVGFIHESLCQISGIKLERPLPKELQQR